MDLKRILCPVDFSECSQEALQHACSLAEQHGAKLFIVHVEDVGHTYPPGNPGYVAALDEHRRLIEPGPGRPVLLSVCWSNVGPTQ